MLRGETCGAERSQLRICPIPNAWRSSRSWALLLSAAAIGVLARWIVPSAAGSRSLRPGRAFASAASIEANRRSSSNGFSMKSTAPPFIAATAVDMSPWPVITITGRLKPRRESWPCTARPSISGILTSSNTHPAEIPGAASRNATADSYPTYSKSAE